MKKKYDDMSLDTATRITKKYSTSFSLAVKLLDNSIRQDIYNIYGFVRIADEIVDSFIGYPQEELLDRFEAELKYALEHEISTNPVLNAFQKTVKKHNIPLTLVYTFLKSMRADLTKSTYTNQEEIDKYIYGSADVVGLMCLKIFVQGNEKQYDELSPAAIKLGSAFQKVNFLRDLKQDAEDLNRTYFPDVDPQNLTEYEKNKIILEIKEDFRKAKLGIKKLPKEARFGVYVAYIYYSKLLQKMVKTPACVLKEKRIRISNTKKFSLLFQSFMKYKLNFI